MVCLLTWLTNVLKAMDAYNTQNYTDFNNYLKLAGDAVTGTSLTNWNYSCAEDDPTNCGYSLSYVPDAILEEALFDLSSGTDGSSRYMVLLDYCKFTFRQLNSSTYWGVDATYDKENDKLIVNDRSKLYVSEPITMEFGEQPEKINANKSNLVAFPESILPSMEVQENIARQIKEGKIPEKKPCIFTRGGYTQKDVERLILNMPFKRFEDMGFMSHSKFLGVIRVDRSIMHRLTDEDIQDLKSDCEKALQRYFGNQL